MSLSSATTAEGITEKGARTGRMLPGLAKQVFCHVDHLIALLLTSDSCCCGQGALNVTLSFNLR